MVENVHTGVLIRQFSPYLLLLIQMQRQVDDS